MDKFNDNNQQMASNEGVRQSLEKEMNSRLEAFQLVGNKHQLLLDLKQQIESFDFWAYQKKVKETLLANIQSWSNIIPKSETSPKLDVLLFEYDTTWWKSRQAHAYGIFNWVGYQLSEAIVDLDLPYDMVDKLEHLPSFTLDFYDCFGLLDDDQIVEKEYGINLGAFFDLNGFYELNEYAYFKGSIAIHKVFVELQEQKILDQLNLKEQAMILIGEHDMDERCILIV